MEKGVGAEERGFGSPGAGLVGECPFRFRLSFPASSFCSNAIYHTRFLLFSFTFSSLALASFVHKVSGRSIVTWRPRAQKLRVCWPENRGQRENVRRFDVSEFSATIICVIEAFPVVVHDLPLRVPTSCRSFRLIYSYLVRGFRRYP